MIQETNDSDSSPSPFTKASTLVPTRRTRIIRGRFARRMMSGAGLDLAVSSGERNELGELL